jgi:hypothetical protein
VDPKSKLAFYRPSKVPILFKDRSVAWYLFAATAAARLPAFPNWR